MKVNKYSRIFSVVVMLVAAITLTSTLVFALTVDEYILQGRNQLSQQTMDGLKDANTSFQSALTLESTNPEANFFYSFTRLAVLFDDTVNNNFKELLDGFGVDAAGRDLFNWTASIPEDLEGNIILPSDSPSGTDVQTFLQSVVIPEIDEAIITNLGNINNTFNIILSTEETGELNDINVDYGDVLLYKSLLYAAKALILIIDSYDLGVDIDAVVAKINDDTFNINSDLLDAYSNLLTLLSDGVGATRIGEARDAVLAAIDRYNDASDFIRGETYDPNDLIALDPEDLAEEADFRSVLADIEDSITNRQPVDMGDEEEVFRVDFSEFFDDPISVRDYLPGFTHDPYIDEILINGISSFPDRTFSGIFPDGLPPEEYEIYIDKVVVWGGNSEGGPFTVIFCWVNGLAPWDIESLIVYGPDGLRYDFDVEQDIRTHYRFGTTYRYKVSGTFPDGWYHFVLKDKEGRDYHGEKHFTPNLINVVDMSVGASPAGAAYAGTTTPVFSWAPVTDETIGALYYRVNIMDWNKKVTIYTSDMSTQTSVTVPDSVLEPDTAYKWNVQVFDSQNGISANNFSSSEWLGFTTGASDEPLTIQWASVRSNIHPDKDQTQLRIKIKGPAPDDVQSITVTHPEGFSYTFNSEDLRQDGAYKHCEDGILPNGDYTFTVEDGRVGVITVTADKTFTFNSLPIPEHLFSPPYQGYIETTTPTFSWSPVTDETASPVYYRIMIFDYSGKRIYKSQHSIETTATVPANILKVNNPYKWRVDVSDKETDPENRSTSGKWSFYIAKENPAASISGQIDPNSVVSGYTSGGVLYVTVRDAPWPEGDILAYTVLTDAGTYTLYNLPVETDLYVYVLWDKDGSGNYTPGDWVGEYGIITLAAGTNSGIDISLSNEVGTASVSGNILCDDFESGLGDIYISACDGHDPSSARLLDSTSITNISDTYTLSNLAENGYVYLFARWDKDGSGTPSAADYRGSYSGNPLLIESTGHTDIDITVVNKLASAINNGLQWLCDNQNADGSWGTDEYVLGTTEFATLAFLNHGYNETDPVVASAMSFILSKVRGSDGAISEEYSGGSRGYVDNYTTAIGIMVLAAADKYNSSKQYTSQITNATRYLLSIQNTEVNIDNFDNTNPAYGGWGYGEPDLTGNYTWADLSNSQWDMLALHEARDMVDGTNLTKAEVNEALARALIFVQRCQNRPATNDLAWAHDTSNPSYNDGGFIYNPGSTNEIVYFNSYDTMTYAGIWGLYSCDVTTDDPRLTDCLNWARDHFTVDPRWRGDHSLYYLYYTMAKALTIIGEAANDVTPDWFNLLAEQLIIMQEGDGSWININQSEGEGIQALTTGYALLALATQTTSETATLDITLTGDATLSVTNPNGTVIPGDPNVSFEAGTVLSGTYLIDITGTGDGTYTLSMNVQDGANIITIGPFTKDITNGEIHRYRLVVTYITGFQLELQSETPESTIPSIEITNPSSPGEAADDLYGITWHDGDLDDNATIHIYYDDNTDDTEYIAEITQSGGIEEDGPNYLDWDVSGLSEGATYYIYATISDGTITNSVYSTGTVTVSPDGMPRAWEEANGLNVYKPDGDGDLDNDGLSNLDEYLNNTDPRNWDTDNDSMPDGWEVEHELDPLADDSSNDPDNDGFTNQEEYEAGTDPGDPDSKPTLKGDLNGDGNVNLADAILALQVLAGLNADEIHLSADVNEDGKIGLAEVIYILQKVADLR